MASEWGRSTTRASSDATASSSREDPSSSTSGAECRRLLTETASRPLTAPSTGDCTTRSPGGSRCSRLLTSTRACRFPHSSARDVRTPLHARRIHGPASVSAPSRRVESPTRSLYDNEGRSASAVASRPEGGSSTPEAVRLGDTEAALRRHRPGMRSNQCEARPAPGRP